MPILHMTMGLVDTNGSTERIVGFEKPNSGISFTVQLGDPAKPVYRGNLAPEDGLRNGAKLAAILGADQGNSIRPRPAIEAHML